MDRWIDVSGKTIKVFIEEMSPELILENGGRQMLVRKRGEAQKHAQEKP